MGVVKRVETHGVQFVLTVVFCNLAMGRWYVQGVVITTPWYVDAL